VGKTQKLPSTPALRLLRQQGVPHTVHVYDYVEKGGTRASSEALGVDEHIVIKTLIFEDDKGGPLIVLMHGDKKVSAKELARALGVKRVAPCDPEVANRHSGYQVGGTSPFGTRKKMPVYMESSIAELEHIFINGGARGLLVRIEPKELERLLSPVPVDVAI